MRSLTFAEASFAARLHLFGFASVCEALCALRTLSNELASLYLIVCACGHAKGSGAMRACACG